MEKKHGSRLYRKLNKDLFPGQPIGKNTLSTMGKFLGKAIGKSDYERLTGHWQRRTSITLAAEKGNILAVSEYKLFQLILFTAILQRIITTGVEEFIWP